MDWMELGTLERRMDVRSIHGWMEGLRCISFGFLVRHGVGTSYRTVEIYPDEQRSQKRANSRYLNMKTLLF
jgi:hypothetical protein